MRPSVILVSLLLAFAAAPTLAAEEMTEDQCVKQYLQQPNKDWQGYDNCRRGATQLKIRGVTGSTNRNAVLPPANAQPNANGGTSPTGTNGQ